MVARAVKGTTQEPFVLTTAPTTGTAPADRDGRIPSTKLYLGTAGLALTFCSVLWGVRFNGSHGVESESLKKVFLNTQRFI